MAAPGRRLVFENIFFDAAGEPAPGPSCLRSNQDLRLIYSLIPQDRRPFQEASVAYRAAYRSNVVDETGSGSAKR